MSRFTYDDGRSRVAPWESVKIARAKAAAEAKAAAAARGRRLADEARERVIEKYPDDQAVVDAFGERDPNELGRTRDQFGVEEDFGLDDYGDDVPKSGGRGRSSGGSGRSGGGAAGPVYIAPDRLKVEEYVNDKFIVLTGKKSGAAKKIVDAYMADAKAAWEGKSIDPATRAVDAIRKTDSYKRIHKFRADSTDEATWITDRVRTLEQRGVSSEAANERGLMLAAQGTAVTDIETGAFNAGRGVKDIGMLQDIRRSAEQVARLI